MRKFLEMSEEQQLTLIKKRFRQSESHTGDWRKEAKDLYAMVAGDQWDEQDRLILLEQRRPIVTFNVSGKYLDAISGLQIANRQEVKYNGREPNDAGFGEYMTGIADWARDEADAEDEESEAFMDLCVTGMGWMELDINFDTDPDGEIGASRIDPLEMYWDPRARKRNLRDRRWQLRIKTFSEEEVLDRWGEDKLQAITGSMGIEPFDDILGDGAIHHASEAWKYEHESLQVRDEDSIPVVEFQTFETVTQVRVDSQYGKREFTMEQWRKFEQVLKQNGVKYRARKYRDRKYYRVYAAGNVILEAEESPYQDGFTIQCITGKRDRNKNSWYGIGRAIRDPQMWLNKLFATILHAMASNSKGGLMAEESAFSDPARAEEEWSNPDAITWMEDGALSGPSPKVKEKTPAQYPAGLDRLMTFAMNALPETSGLNMEIMGMANRVQPGVVEAQRKEAAMTVIAWAFDSMRRYYKDHGRQLAYYIREYMADGRLARIKGRDGEKYVPLLRDKLAMKFDVVVDEAPTSINVKERVWIMLEALMPSLVKMGLPIPPEVIDYSPLPQDLQDAWKKVLNKQPTPEQKKAQELENQEKEAEIDKDRSVAELNRAKAVETGAKAGATAAGA